MEVLCTSSDLLCLVGLGVRKEEGGGVLGLDLAIKF